MAIEFRKAERKKAKLRLALIAPSGNGKTYSSLRIATGIGGKIAMIDTENGSGDLYADRFDYDIITMNPPYLPEKYVTAIKAAEEAGYTTIIIDSLSHAWSGQGGLLDQQGKMADTGKNSFTAWRTITPKHNALVESIIGSKCHVIATMRAKTEYAVDKDEKGKTEIRKIGLSPVQRDGVEYEFTIVMDLSDNHLAKTSKDRTSLFDGQIFEVNEDTGKQLTAWLNTEKKEAPKREPKKAPITEKDLKEAFGDDVEFVDVTPGHEEIRKNYESLLDQFGSLDPRSDAIESETLKIKIKEIEKQNPWLLESYE